MHEDTICFASTKGKGQSTEGTTWIVNFFTKTTMEGKTIKTKFEFEEGVRNETKKDRKDEVDERREEERVERHLSLSSFLTFSAEK